MNNIDFEEIEGDLALYEQGRQLRVIYNTPAWSVMIQALEDYRDKAIETLISLAPGDPVVPTAHAAASALDDMVAKFKMDIANAIEMAANPSEEVAAYLAGAFEAQDVAKATGHGV